MTNNFTPKKSGTAARPQLSPEEYAAKKKAEKDAVYQMIDDTATEIVSDPDKFRAYLDTQARMDRYSAANALLIYKQQPQATQLKDAAKLSLENSDLEEDEIIERVDVKTWYQDEGEKIISRMIDDLNAQGHRKLTIRENGEAYITASGTEEMVEYLCQYK